MLECPSDKFVLEWQFVIYRADGNITMSMKFLSLLKVLRLIRQTEAPVFNRALNVMLCIFKVICSFAGIMHLLFLDATPKVPLAMNLEMLVASTKEQEASPAFINRGGLLGLNTGIVGT